jgi:hypothetical protein
MSTSKEDAMDLTSLLVSEIDEIDLHPLALDFMEGM